MSRTYRAVLRDDRVEWLEQPPQQADARQVRITVLPEKYRFLVDILGFEFERGLFPNVLDEARAKGIDIAAEVFDKRAVDRNQVV